MKQGGHALVRVGLRKENIKSVIITSDKEFKRKAITFLNGSAIAAEKFVVEHMQNALTIFEQDPALGNFIIDGTLIKFSDLKAQLELYMKHKANGDSRLLVFLEEAQVTLAERDALQAMLPQANIFFTPMAQAQFNKSFHGNRTPLQAPKESESKKPAPAGPTSSSATAASPASASEQSKNSVTLLETSAHLKETVELLNGVAKDKNRTDLVRTIGQRFNGLIGAFAFLKSSPGFMEMQNLARIVDDVSRTYRDDATRSISEKHWDLLFESAKALYLILRELREHRPVPETLLTKAAQLEKTYAATSDLSRRQSQSQAAIDELLESELLKRIG